MVTITELLIYRQMEKLVQIKSNLLECFVFVCALKWAFLCSLFHVIGGTWIFAMKNCDFKNKWQMGLVFLFTDIVYFMRTKWNIGWMVLKLYYKRANTDLLSSVSKSGRIQTGKKVEGNHFFVIFVVYSVHQWSKKISKLHFNAWFSQWSFSHGKKSQLLPFSLF